jgi:hypothetical protein
MGIQYLTNNRIDKKAWDTCIAGSFNGNIFAFSWFLDILCEDWDALIEGNYEAVMPLTKRRFIRREIIVPPALGYELGIFSFSPVVPAKTRSFIEALPKHFAYYRILLNKYNPIDNPPAGMQYIAHNRFELDLIEPYFRMAADFTAELQRRLNLAMARGFYLSSGLSPNDLIRFIREHKITVSKAFKDHHYRLLRSVIAGLISYKAGELYGIYDARNELTSVALIAWFNTRINLICQVTNPGRKKDFPHMFLIDRIIDKYAETSTTLLFDQGIDPSYVSGYKDFGAKETSYIEIIHNKLPFPFNRMIDHPILKTRLLSLHVNNS